MAQIRFMDNGNLRTMQRMRIADNGSLRVIQRVRVMVNGVLQTVYQYFTATISRSNVSGIYNGASSTPQDITTSMVAAVVSGGTSPFTYAWTRTDNGPDNWTILSNSSSNTAFKATSVLAGTSAYANFQCTVTDASGAKAVTPSVAAEADNASTAPTA